MLDAPGKRPINLCKSTNLHIGNGHLKVDKDVGDFTFFNQNGASVVDYFLLHQDDFKYIKQYAVMPPNEFSDHCALHICIERMRSDVISRETESSAPELFICWDDTEIEHFDNIATLEQVIDNINSVSIDRSMDLFTTYMKENAFSVFGKPRKQYTNSPNSHTRNRKKKWFDKECFEKRKAFNKARNVFIRNKSIVNKLEYLGKKTHVQ